MEFRSRCSVIAKVVFLTSGMACAGSVLATSKIDLVVQVPRGTTGDLYLTGNTPQLCSWQPQCLRFDVVDKITRRVTFDFVGDPKTLAFKVTRGTWASEAADPWGRPWNNITLNRKTSTMVLDVANWKDWGPLTAAPGVRLISNFAIPQLGLHRRVWVWTPPSYETNPDKHYPVLYMHDGQNVFDPTQGNSFVAWRPDLVVGDTIVVAVEASSDGETRAREYDYRDHGAAYADFLVSTLKPWLDQNYRTISDRDHTWMMGSSLGGLITLETLWMHADVFSRGAALSLAAHYDNQSIYQVIRRDNRPSLPLRLYIDRGDWGNDDDYPQYVDPFVDHLRALGFGSDSLSFRIFHFADHSEADWARRLEWPIHDLGITSLRVRGREQQARGRR